MNSNCKTDSPCFNIYYTNANGLKNKLSELSFVSSDEQFGFKLLCVTETMFQPSMFDAELNIPNFKLFRQDRLNSEGGGSCIYVHKSISRVSRCVNFNIPDCIAVSIDLDTIKLIIIILYRSPSLLFCDCIKIIDQLTVFLNSLSNDSEIIIVGDLNLPNVSWNDGIVKCPINTVNKSYIMQSSYLQFFSTFNLQWVLTDDIITRRRKVLNTIQEATLDQILLSDKGLLKSYKTLSGLGKSDHISLVFNIGVSNDSKFLSMKKENWSKFKTEDIVYHGNGIDWNYSNYITSMSTDEMWNELERKFHEISKHVPKFELKLSKDGSVVEKLPWYKPCLQKARKLKDSCWKTFDEYPTAKNFRLAAQKEKDFEDKLKVLMNYEYKITSNMKTNPKSFFRYLNSKRKVKDSLNCIKGPNGEYLSIPEEVADELGSFFESTFVSEPEGAVPSLLQRSVSDIPDINIRCPSRNCAWTDTVLDLHQRYTDGLQSFLALFADDLKLITNCTDVHV